jgi:magnesium chelatase subunit I
LHIPKYVAEVIERIAFCAREDKRVDKRSGVSQRLPISCMENVISNAERRAIRNAEERIVPRISDIYSAMPAITGKLELEYEGEVKGADTVARELIRTAIASTYDQYFHGQNMQQVIQWFDLGGNIQLSDLAPASEVSETLKGIQGLNEKLSPLGIKSKDPAEVQVSAAEFILEGLYAHKRIGRSEERVFTAGERQPKREMPERDSRERDRYRDELPFRNKKGFN